MDYASRIRTIFEEVKRAERVLGQEFLIKSALVMVASLCAWWFLDLNTLLYWSAAYCVVALLEKAIIYARIEGREIPAFLALWVIGFVLASIFAYLPTYIWMKDGDAWKFGACILFAAAMLNIFLFRARHWLLGLAYVIPVLTAAGWIAFGFFESPNGGLSFWLSLAMCGMLTINIAVCIIEAHRAGRELADTRAQFLQSQKVEALGTLTSGVAHDFNNLLSVIQGNLELLQAYPTDPSRDEYLSAALTASKRGAQLTRQLTSYGRKAELSARYVAPNTILRGLEDMARRVLPANIDLSLRTTDTDSTTFVDETLLQSALLNLIINARDAMPNGGKLKVKVIDPVRRPLGLKLAEGANYMAFEVVDNGHGIPADLMSRIRDPFFSTKGIGGGSGLGLPMVCGFAAQSGGDVEINSREGKGTSVRVYLPRTIQPPGYTPLQARPRPTSATNERSKS